MSDITPQEPQKETTKEVKKDVEFTMPVGDNPSLPIIEHEKTEGRGKGFHYYIKLDGTVADPFADVRKAVGAENFNSCVADMLRTATKDAAHDAKDSSGKFDGAKFAANLVEWFKPASRKKSGGIKELREKLQELQNKMTPFSLKFASGDSISDAEQFEFVRIAAEYRDVNAKIEEKSRQGKGKKEVTPAQ